jgi:hypothetical protein
MDSNAIVQFILNPVLPVWALILKFIFLALGLFYMVFIIISLLKTKWLRWLVIWDTIEYMTYRHYGLGKVEGKWAKIKERLEVGTEPEAKLAIIEAEGVLDGILKEMGYAGDNFSERLNKLTTDIIANLEDLKEAHQVRSNIVHDPSYHLEIKEAKNILDIYEETLTELHVL